MEANLYIPSNSSFVLDGILGRVIEKMQIQAVITVFQQVKYKYEKDDDSITNHHPF